MANLFDVLSGAGNLLDLPGSSVRDLLSGRNPITRHVDSSALAPAAYGAAYNAIARFQTNGGMQ